MKGVSGRSEGDAGEGRRAPPPGSRPLPRATVGSVRRLSGEGPTRQSGDEPELPAC